MSICGVCFLEAVVCFLYGNMRPAASGESMGRVALVDMMSGMIGLMQSKMQYTWRCCHANVKVSNHRTVRGLGSSSSIACLQASKRFRLGVGKETDFIASEDSILAGSVEEVMLYVINYSAEECSCGW